MKLDFWFVVFLLFCLSKFTELFDMHLIYGEVQYNGHSAATEILDRRLKLSEIFKKRHGTGRLQLELDHQKEFLNIVTIKLSVSDG